MIGEEARRAVYGVDKDTMDIFFAEEHYDGCPPDCPALAEDDAGKGYCLNDGDCDEAWNREILPF